MACCPNCFNHPWLREHIQNNSAARGACDYCGGPRAPLIEVHELSGYFSNLVSMYSPLIAGQTLDDLEDPLNVGENLVYLIQEDWDVFSESLVESDRAHALLEEIVNSSWDDDSGEPPLDAYELHTRRQSIYRTTMTETWQQFRAEVRDNPEIEPQFDLPFAEEIGRTCAILSQQTTLYRARIGFTENQHGTISPYRGQEIGAPPPELTPPGRANAKGRPVLYSADQEETAIAEKRPARGLSVSVCRLRSRRDLHIVDLSVPLEVPNPFLTELLAYEVDVVHLLNSFAAELSEPLEREDNPADYLPSQKLTRLIQDLGFDGIRYPSALASNGSNVVFFDPSVAELMQSKLVTINEVTFMYSNLQDWQ